MNGMKDWREGRGGNIFQSFEKLKGGLEVISANLCAFLLKIKSKGIEKWRIFFVWRLFVQQPSNLREDFYFIYIEVYPQIRQLHKKSPHKKMWRLCIAPCWNFPIVMPRRKHEMH